MGEKETDQPLPDGWRMEVKVRKNGRKDKYYHAPCGGLKFNSRAQVSLYLNTSDPKSEEKRKHHPGYQSAKVMVEKVTAEGLPPGWIKEVKITKKSRRVRRDPYYIDPVSGYVFRSMRDALRYVETGEVGRHAFKPKNQENNDEDLENDKICSPTVAVNGTERHVIDSLDSNLGGVAKDQQMLSSAVSGKQSSLTEHASTLCKAEVGTESISLNLPADKGSEEIGGKNSHECALASVAADGVLPNRQSWEDENKEDETKTKRTQLSQRKSKVKKALNLPRRASKRLAGVALDPTPELKSNTRARRSVVKQLCEIVASSSEGSCRTSAEHDQSESAQEASCAFDTFDTKNFSLEPKKNMSSSGSFTTTNKRARNSETESRGNEKHDLPQGKQAMLELHSEKVVIDGQPDGMQGPPIDLPLADLWADPCIAFAIKTLTGISDDTPKFSSESNSSKSLPETLITLEEHSGREESGNENGGRLGCAVALPLEDPAIHLGKANKTNEKPESLHNVPLPDIWADPCIEFAIKTLTGAIPVGYDLENQGCFLSQPSSTQTQSGSHFSQTSFLCQQYDVKEKPMSYRSPGGKVLHHTNAVKGGNEYRR